MEYVVILLVLVMSYLLTCKAWPYVLYPNYFRPSRVETYAVLRTRANEFRASTQMQTLEHAFSWMRDTYSGSAQVYRVSSLLSVFEIGDFSTEHLFSQKRFLWCHTQNRLLKSILLNTGMFDEKDIVIHKRMWSSFFIHQWLVVNTEGGHVAVDPYYGHITRVY